MSSTLFGFILLNLFISTLVGGLVFISTGYKLNRNLKLIATGWIIIGITSFIGTVGLVYLSIESGIGVVFLLLISPLAIIGGLIVTAILGATNLIKGYRKKDKSLISSGWVCLIIHAVVVTTIVLLSIFFSAGIIPIRLM